MPLLGHQPILPPRIVRDVPFVASDLLARFEGAASADVADLVGALYVMSPRIGPLYKPMRPLVGRALTIKAWPGDNLAVHGALTMCKKDDVLVIDWRSYTEACGGGSQMLSRSSREGLRGVVIDGAWRDSAELQALDLPVYACGTSPFSPAKQKAGEINVPVCCGGVVVEPGDILIADQDGVVVVPHAYSERVADRLQSSKASIHENVASDEQRTAMRASAFFEIFDQQGGVDGERR